MKKLLVAVIAACQLVSAVAASGAEQKGPLSISAVAGGYTFEGTQHLKTGPLYGGRLGYELTQGVDMEALFDYARTKNTITNDSASMYRLGADLLFNLMPDSRIQPNLAVGISGISLDGTGLDKGLRAAWSYGAGIKYFMTENIALRGDVRHIIFNNNYTTFNNLEYTIGVHIPFGRTKTTEKPVASSPAVPVTTTPEAVKSVTPAPAASVALTPTVKQRVVPSLNNPTDSDGDGVRDSLDRCPDTSPGTIVDSYGCPKINTPAQKAEIAKRFCDKPAVLTISFDTGKADISAEYFMELSRVGTFLREFPASKGTIEGHTDNAGSITANTRLSQRRAENVRGYLIKSFGIEPDRITAVGFGPAKPVASNKTAAGKAKNRRIETVFSCE